ncbi:TPA: beta-glucoside-specific PTS transporter subunit IIABC [Mannheimia haemolytica]
MSKNFTQLAQDIVKNVGGRENISHLEHCSTRLRFTLVDNSKADIDALKGLQGVLSVVTGVQCQVVIGNEVFEVYDEVAKLVGNITASTGEQTKEKQSLGKVILDFVVGVFQPLVPAIAGGGVLKSILILLSVMGVLEKTDHTYQVLNMIGDAPLFFLPILVAYTTANKLKVNPLVAISIVGVMILPNMTAFLKAEGATLFGLDLQNIAYAYQVFPAILTVLLYSQAEKYLTKYTPKAIRIFFVPLMSMVIVAPIALLLLGPLGFNIGTYFASAVLALYETVGWLAVGVLAAILPFMVATGMHKAMLPYAITTYSNLHKEMFYMPASLAHNIAESGACFAVALKSKEKNLKSTALSAGISALCGITEPALYGVTLLHKKVLYSVMFGAVVAGCYVGYNVLAAFAVVGPGLPSMTMFVSESDPMNFVHACIGFAIAWLVPFIAALFLFKEDIAKNNEKVTAITTGETLLISPVNGVAIPLEQVNDKVFSSKALGDGVGLIPSEGKLYAPANGIVEMVYVTKHAIGFKTDTGIEVLFHIGVDTMKLSGKYFDVKVTENQKVERGQLLVEFDKQGLESAGFDTTIMMIVTEPNGKNVVLHQSGEINTNTLLMKVE